MDLNMVNNNHNTNIFAQSKQIETSKIRFNKAKVPLSVCLFLLAHIQLSFIESEVNIDLKCIEYSSKLYS